MALVVDASVALKWVLQEPLSAAARRLGVSDSLAAPELLFIECANVLAMKVRRGLMSASEAEAGMRVIEGLPIRALPARAHVREAQAIAVELRQSAYDSLYLAVAMAARSTFVTADEAFARAAKSHPIFGPHVRLLED